MNDTDADSSERVEEAFLYRFRNVMLPLLPIIGLVAWVADVPLVTVGQYAIPVVGAIAIISVYVSSENGGV